jgi:hypothetical protein
MRAKKFSVSVSLIKSTGETALTKLGAGKWEGQEKPGTNVSPNLNLSVLNWAQPQNRMAKSL